MPKKYLALVLLVVVFVAVAATAKTEVKVAPKPAVKAVVKPTVKPSVKPIAKPVAKPAVKPVVKMAPAVLKSRLEKYIQVNLLTDGTKFTLDTPVLGENGLYLVNVTLENSQKVASYASVDGKLFFPQALEVKDSDLLAKPATPADKPSVEPSGNVSVKNDKPVVELFVMSYCPYGTQMEKGIIPVVETLGSNIDFKIKFVDYAMHGDKELKENMVQYCIGQNEPAKLLPYLKCFLEGADSAACLAKSGVDNAKLTTCVADTDKAYAITTAGTPAGSQFPAFNIYKADNVKYGVQGSPTLVVNGSEVNTGRSASALLTTICSAFNVKPAACEAKLSAETPAPGFGTGTTNNATTGAACGNN